VNLSSRTQDRSRWLIGLVALAGAVGITVATAAAYVVSHTGNEPLPAGVHTVEVYTVDDAISTVFASGDRPGVAGRFLGMCDADTHYVEVDGAGLCVVLNGSLGRIDVTATDRGVEISADQAAKARAIVGTEGSTRVLLGYDGGWAGMVDVADLNAGGPVTGHLVG
jgi:hypothetical protein